MCPRMPGFRFSFHALPDQSVSCGNVAEIQPMPVFRVLLELLCDVVVLQTRATRIFNSMVNSMDGNGVEGNVHGHK